jgi:hypothetical protein
VLGAAYFRNGIAWWKNNGGNPITWTKQTIGTGLVQACLAIAVDIDGDGQLDVVGTAQGSNEVAWWRNDGGNPIVWTKFVIDSLKSPWPVFTIDFDKDGTEDVLAAGAWGEFPVNGWLKWYDNFGDSCPSTPTEFRASCDYPTATSIRLRWKDPSLRMNGHMLSNFKIHLYRNYSFLAEVDAGIQTYVDTGQQISQFYHYYIRAITVEDSSIIDSTTLYDSEIVTNYLEDFEAGVGSVYRTGT